VRFGLWAMLLAASAMGGADAPPIVEAKTPDGPARPEPPMRGRSSGSPSLKQRRPGSRQRKRRKAQRRAGHRKRR
jgi:hypothetical protein